MPEFISYSLAHHPAPDREEIPLSLLLFGLFGAPIAWAADLIADYCLVAHACFPGPWPRTAPLPALGSVHWIVLGIHLAALAAIAASTAASYRVWRLTGPPRGHYHHLIERGEGRSRYLGIVGMGFGAMFFLLTATETVALALVVPCLY